MENAKDVAKTFTSYLNEVNVEFKKITWPDRHELIDSTAVVISFIVILAVVVLCCDKAIMLFLDLVLKS